MKLPIIVLLWLIGLSTAVVQYKEKSKKLIERITDPTEELTADIKNSLQQEINVEQLQDENPTGSEDIIVELNEEDGDKEGVVVEMVPGEELQVTYEQAPITTTNQFVHNIPGKSNYHHYSSTTSRDGFVPNPGYFPSQITDQRPWPRFFSQFAPKLPPYFQFTPRHPMPNPPPVRFPPPQFQRTFPPEMQQHFVYFSGSGPNYQMQTETSEQVNPMLVPLFKSHRFQNLFAMEDQNEMRIRLAEELQNLAKQLLYDANTPMKPSFHHDARANARRKFFRSRFFPDRENDDSEPPHHPPRHGREKYVPKKMPKRPFHKLIRHRFSGEHEQDSPLKRIPRSRHRRAVGDEEAKSKAIPNAIPYASTQTQSDLRKSRPTYTSTSSSAYSSRSGVTPEQQQLKTIMVDPASSGNLPELFAFRASQTGLTGSSNSDTTPTAAQPNQYAQGYGQAAAGFGVSQYGQQYPSTPINQYSPYSNPYPVQPNYGYGQSAYGATPYGGGATPYGGGATSFGGSASAYNPASQSSVLYGATANLPTRAYEVGDGTPGSPPFSYKPPEAFAAELEETIRKAQSSGSSTSPASLGPIFVKDPEDEKRKLEPPSQPAQTTTYGGSAGRGSYTPYQANYGASRNYASGGSPHYAGYPQAGAYSPYGAQPTYGGAFGSPYGVSQWGGYGGQPYGADSGYYGYGQQPNGGQQYGSQYGAYGSSAYGGGGYGGQAQGRYSGQSSPYGGASSPYGGASSPYGGASSPYGGATSPYGGATSPYGGTRGYGGGTNGYGGTSGQGSYGQSGTYGQVYGGNSRQSTPSQAGGSNYISPYRQNSGSYGSTSSRFGNFISPYGNRAGAASRTNSRLQGSSSGSSNAGGSTSSGSNRGGAATSGSQYRGRTGSQGGGYGQSGSQYSKSRYPGESSYGSQASSKAGSQYSQGTSSSSQGGAARYPQTSGSQGTTQYLQSGSRYPQGSSYGGSRTGSQYSQGDGSQGFRGSQGQSLSSRFGSQSAQNSENRYPQSGSQYPQSESQNYQSGSQYSQTGGQESTDPRYKQAGSQYSPSVGSHSGSQSGGGGGGGYSSSRFGAYISHTNKQRDEYDNNEPAPSESDGGGEFYYYPDDYDGDYGTDGQSDYTTQSPQSSGMHLGNGIHLAPENSGDQRQVQVVNQGPAPIVNRCANNPYGLPDLVVDHRKLRPSVFLDKQSLTKLSCAAGIKGCLTLEREPSTSMRSLLRFSTIIENQGDADFLPHRDSDNWEYHACHDHHHSMSEFAIYEIYKTENSTHTLMAKGHKPSFCLQDTNCRNSCPKRFNCTGPKDDPPPQGISPQCYDEYLASLDCQWIDITGIPYGSYTLRITVNAQHDVMEKDFDNNIVECSVKVYARTALAETCHNLKNRTVKTLQT